MAFPDRKARFGEILAFLFSCCKKSRCECLELDITFKNAQKALLVVERKFSPVCMCVCVTAALQLRSLPAKDRPMRATQRNDECSSGHHVPVLASEWQRLGPGQRCLLSSRHRQIAIVATNLQHE